MGKNESAFPQSGFPQWQTMPGMTMRDYFAAKALQSFGDALIEGSIADALDKMELCAKLSYRLADAMLAAREFEHLDSAVAWLSSARKASHGEFARDTAEQIAAQQREALELEACTEIEPKLDGYNVDLDCSAAIRMTIHAMIDAGYRKKEQK